MHTQYTSAQIHQELHIDLAVPQDAAALLHIYRPYVEHTAVTFEYETPSEEEFAQRIQRVLQKFPYLIARRGDEIMGYAYADRFHERAAYGWAAETTVYVRDDCKRQGVGRRLYTELEQRLQQQGILNLNACIACARETDPYLNGESALFHEKMGYRLVGRFDACGYKLGRWYDMIWMEKHIGPHTCPPAPVQAWKDIAAHSGQIRPDANQTD